MSHPAHHLSDALGRRLRRLDARLHIDHQGRSEWVWAGPVLTLLGTVALVVVFGIRSGIDAAMYVPLALLLGAAMAGMSIAYMTPASDDQNPPPDDGGHDHDPGAGPPPPQPTAAPPRKHPVPSWYRRLDEPTVDEPAPPRRGATPARR